MARSRGAYTEPCDAEEMIYAARLNWEVEKLPIPNVGASAHKRPRRYHLIRIPLTNSEPEVPLGVVSSRYRPLQNFEAFRIARYLTPNATPHWRMWV